MTATYTIILSQDPESGAVNVTVPAMPGVLTWAATREGALDAAREAIELHLEGYVERGRPFPSDRRAPGADSARIDVTLPDGASRQSA